MKIEIETKIRVESLEEAVRALREAGGVFVGDFVEFDRYFDDAGKGLLSSGCGLRLRRRSGGGKDGVFLTYKGPRQGGRFKSRPELNIAVESFEDMSTVLGELGFESKLEFEKHRSIWEYGGCEVCLDELEGLGKFIEVEGENEAAICKVLSDLGLGGYEHIDQGYASMMSERE